MNKTYKRSGSNLNVIFNVIFVTLFSSNVLAADWEFTPSLTVAETYSDNIDQSPSDAEESDFVTELNPGFSLQGTGRRLQLSIDYQLQNLFYADNSDANDSQHTLTADINAELINQFLFMDVLGAARQVLVTPTGEGQDNNLVISDDRTTAVTYSLSPYAIRQFGTMLGELRYTFEKVDFIGDNNEDSDSSGTHSLYLSLASNPNARSQSRAASYRGRSLITNPTDNLEWTLSYNRDETEFDSGDDDKFESIEFDSLYRIGAQTSAVLTLGYENNDFDQASGAEEPDGLIWSVGLAWNPTRRTTIEASYGRRFFGSTYSLDLRHATRSLAGELQYTEELSTTNDALLEEQLLANDPINPTDDETEISATVPLVPLPELGSEVFLRRRLSANITKTTAKSTFSLNAYSEEREFQRSAAENQVYGTELSWEWQIAARTISTVFAEWQRQEVSQNNQEEFDFWQFGVRVDRRVSDTIRAYIDYSYARRDSTLAEEDYMQNQIAAGLQVSF